MTTEEIPPEMQHAMFTSWPNTPGPQRLIHLANQLQHQRGPHPTEGLNSYIERLEAHRFRQRAHSNWKQQDTSTTWKTLEVLTAIAVQGDSTNTIGLAILTRRNTIRRLFPWPSARHRCTFSRLPRDPAWMGLDPTLALLTGLTALVIEGQPSQTPSFVLALPPAMAQQHPQEQQEPFPEGQAQTLAELLRWHLAGPLWLPRPPDEHRPT